MDKQSATYSQEELAVMAMFKTYKPSYRAQQMERAGLGEYNPENPTIKSLVGKGLIKVRGGKAMQIDRKKAVSVLLENDAPDKYKRYIDNYSMTFKRKEATTAARVVDRYRQATDEFLTVEEIADICSKCAFEMVTAGLEGAYRSDLNRMINAAKWNSLPKGWTQESVKKFWASMTGDRKHKVTACIKKMEGGGIDDPGAFCASLADKMEPGWRSRD
jgi:hypothetical protein